MNQFYSSSLSVPGATELERRSRIFLMGLFQHYSGTASEKLDKTAEFLDAMIFKTTAEIDNLFDPEPHNLYKVLVYSRSILLPQISYEINREDPDPFAIHEWN